VKPGDVITVGDRSKTSTVFQANADYARNRPHPEWLTLDDTELAIKVTALPSREQIDTPVDEQLIVEYYSR
jgi:small subunit ribosomal protein S4